MPTYRYQYYTDAQNTDLLTEIIAPDLNTADKVLWNRFKQIGSDLYLFIRQNNL